jgi:hypothetical protein
LIEKQVNSLETNLLKLIGKTKGFIQHISSELVSFIIYVTILESPVSKLEITIQLIMLTLTNKLYSYSLKAMDVNYCWVLWLKIADSDRGLNVLTLLLRLFLWLWDFQYWLIVRYISFLKYWKFFQKLGTSTK